MVSPDDIAGVLYQEAPCGLLLTAEDGTILRANEAICRYLGFAAEALAGKRFQELLSIGGRIYHQTHWMPLLCLQGALSEIQLELVHKEGHAVPMLANAVVRLGDPVTHHIALCPSADRRRYERELLSARRHAEQLLEREREARAALANAEAELRRALEERAVLAEQLIGIVGHDLRTPLSTIVLSAHLLSRTQLSPEQAKASGRISSAGSRAARLAGDLLDFTQARLGGGLRVDARDVDLHALIAECVEEARTAWPGRTLELSCVGTGRVHCDPDRMGQVLTNLINNALSYGAAQAPVSIACTPSDTGIELRVHNAGAPIQAELLPHIFEPLRRGAAALEHGSHSVGLGLFIVREIARAHGGDVSVESSASSGTTFVVTLPRARS